MNKYKLSELFDLQMGKTPARNNEEYWNGTEKWVSIADISKSGKYITETKEQITDKAIKESGIKIVPKDTVIMSFKLTLGRSAITAENMYTNEAIMAFINKGTYSIDNDYTYYLLSALKWDEGSNKAVKGITLNKATLSEKEVFVHDKETQKKIVGALDKVSELISLRKKQLEKLDQLVKARFVELFGDPTITDKDKAYMPMTSICEIIDGDRGKNYPKQEEFYEDGYCLFLNAKNVTSDGFDFTNCMFITKDKDVLLRKGKLNRGDVVLTTRGTIGNLAYYSDNVPFDNVRINSGMVILRMNHELVDEIFFIEQFKLQLAEIKEKIASGSAQPQLPISTMNKIQMLVPEIRKQKDFVAFVEQTDKSKLTIQQSLDKLEVLKESLMQKYFG